MPEDLYLSALERVMAAAFDEAAVDIGDVDPKLSEALRLELTKVYRDHERANMPATHDRYARAIGSHFTVAEALELAAFYKSRTGQKIIVGKFAGMDLSAMLEKFQQNPDSEVTVGDISEINRSAVGKIVQHLDQTDKSELLAFMRTPAFASLRAFLPTMLALEAQIASETDAELDDKMEAATIQVLAHHGVGNETN